MIPYYLWPTKAQAEAALAAINGHSVFPVPGRNAATGTIEGPATTCWAEAPVETADGRWGFPVIPEALLERFNITAETRRAWVTAFAPTIEVPTFPATSDP